MKSLIFIAFVSFGALSNNFEVDLSMHDVKHAWRGDKGYQDYAQFEDVFYGIGLTYWHDNIGLRASYIKGDVMSTLGRYEYVDLHLDHIISVEALYNVNVSDDLSIFAGVSYSWIPTNQRYEGIDLDSHQANDEDNDKGYSVGVKYNIASDVYIGAKYTRFSRIKVESYDEWIDSYSLFVSYKY